MPPIDYKKWNLVDIYAERTTQEDDNRVKILSINLVFEHKETNESFLQKLNKDDILDACTQFSNKKLNNLIEEIF